MAGRTASPSPLQVNNSNHGGYILITAALALVWSILFYFIRLSVRWGYRNRFGSDDWAASVTTAIGVAQSVSIMLAVSSGSLGKQISDLSPSRLLRTEKLVYVGGLLFIFAIAGAKIATLELIARLTEQSNYLLACRTLSVIAAAWGIASALTIGIGCHPSHPWDMVDRCPSLSTSWLSLGIIDICLETSLLILPIVLIWPLQMPWNAKAIVLFAFQSRAPLVAITTLRLLELVKIRHSSNYTFDLSVTMFLMEVQTHFAIMSMTVPCLRPFLKAFNTGGLATYAAQVEIGMGAPPNPKVIATQASQRSSYCYSFRRTSSLCRASRLTLSSAMSRQPIDKRSSDFQFSSHLQAAEEHLVLNPVTSPAITKVRHGRERSISDDESSRHIIRKINVYDVRYSPELKR